MALSKPCACIWSKIDNRFNEWMTNFNYHSFWNEIFAVSSKTSSSSSLSPLANQDCFVDVIPLYNDEINRFSLSVGHDLKREFAVVTILHDSVTNQRIGLEYNALVKFLSMTKELVAINTVYPEKVISSTVTNNSNKFNSKGQILIHMSKHIDEEFILNCDSHVFRTDARCLSDLLRFEQRLLPIMQTMVFDSYKLKECFYKILFCHSEICGHSHNDDDDSFDCIKDIYWCGCMVNPFYWQITTKYNHIMSECVKLFRKVSLYDEANRLKTYQLQWPHTFIDPKMLALLGFFHIEHSEDRVQCVFCDLMLWRWQKNDSVFGEHSRLSPDCPLLRGKRTLNVPIDLDELQKFVPEIDQDFDTVN